MLAYHRLWVTISRDPLIGAQDQCVAHIRGSMFLEGAATYALTLLRLMCLLCKDGLGARKVGKLAVRGGVQLG